MDETSGTKKYSADKITLLGLFVVAVLIARLIIASRSVIALSEPIELSYASLSVSMPAGNGWQNEKQWRRQENGFTLSSFFVPGTQRPVAQARCRYLWVGTSTAPDMRFKQKASAVNGVIAKKGQLRKGEFTIDWAHIEDRKRLFCIFFGTAKLSNNRQLDIEVQQNIGDTNLAEQVFERITESLNLESSRRAAKE